MKNIKLSKLSKETQAAIKKELSVAENLSPERIERTIGYVPSRARGEFISPAYFNWSAIGNVTPEDTILWARALLTKAKEAAAENKSLPADKVDWKI